MGDCISMSISADSSLCETLNRGPLAILLRRKYEFPFGIDKVLFSIFNFFSLDRVLGKQVVVPKDSGFHFVTPTSSSNGENLTPRPSTSGTLEFNLSDHELSFVSDLNGSVEGFVEVLSFLSQKINFVSLCFRPFLSKFFVLFF